MKAVRVRDAAQRARPAALPHRLPPARRLLAAHAGRHRRELRLGAGRAAPRHAAGGAVGRADTPTTSGRRSRRRGRSRSTRPAAPRRRRGARTRPSWRRSCAPWRPPTPGSGPSRERAPIERRFGPYGGRYVPETLIPALDELEREWLAARDDPAFTRRARARCCATTSAGRRRSTCAPRLSEVVGARGLAQARGPAPHRLAQDQQRARPGAAGPADGQAAGDRRDRGGPARRGDGHRLRAARPRVRRLHGHRGHAPPAPNVERMRLLGAEVVAVEAGARTLKEAVIAAIRDWVGNVETHPLRDRLGGRAGALPGARARPAAARSATRRARSCSRRPGGCRTA